MLLLKHHTVFQQIFAFDLKNQAIPVLTGQAGWQVVQDDPPSLLI